MATMLFPRSDLVLQYIDYLQFMTIPLIDQEELFQRSETVFHDLEIPVIIIPKFGNLHEDVVKVKTGDIFDVLAGRCACGSIKQSFLNLKTHYGLDWRELNLSDIKDYENLVSYRD